MAFECCVLAPLSRVPIAGCPRWWTRMLTTAEPDRPTGAVRRHPAPINRLMQGEDVLRVLHTANAHYLDERR